MIEQQRRRLLRHGFVFLFLALWLGLAIMVFPRPMKWMAGGLSRRPSSISTPPVAKSARSRGLRSAMEGQARPFSSATQCE